MRRSQQLLVAAALVGCARSSPSVGQVVTPTVLEHTGSFQASDLLESSGVAVSRKHPGIIWTHNDSGDEPVVYVSNLQGADLGRIRLLGTQARDWEDIAVGYCPDGQDTCIYVADTGDNDRVWPSVFIHVFPEPDNLPDSESTVIPRTLRLRYAEGSQNVEALAVRGNGQIWLFTKGLGESSVAGYRIDGAAVIGELGGSTTVSKAFQLDFTPAPFLGQLVTGAAFSPSGERLVVRTYMQLRFYRVGPNDQLEPQGECAFGIREPQGEAVDFLDEEALVLTSESNKPVAAPIHRVICPIG